MTVDLFGSMLSPFSAKLRIALDAVSQPYRWLPEEGPRAASLALLARRQRALAGLGGLAVPLGPLDELPLVPYLLDEEGRLRVDSTSIGRWLADGALRPRDPLSRFVCDLLEECVDEVGLYLLHHQRWVVSARDHRVIPIVLGEFGKLLPRALHVEAAERFAARQVRRLPYLFSVAPWTASSDLPRVRRPPSRPGFPPTHALLERLFLRWTEALEAILARSPYLLGARPTLADCAVAGSVRSMLLVDTSTAGDLRARCPRLVEHAFRGPNELASALRAELDRPDEQLLHAMAPIVSSTLPLLFENERAFERWQPGALRNEAAFDASEQLFDGVLEGTPYRAGTKTFQVSVLHALRGGFRALPMGDQQRLTAAIPELEEFAP